MLHRIYAVAKNTFRESMRDRILLSVVVFMLGMIGFTLFIGSVSLGEEERMVVDFGVAAIFLLQVFVAIFIGSMLLYREFERKTFFLLIPKPITREEIIAGKFLGLLSTTTAVTLLSAAVLFIIFIAKGMSAFMLPVALALLFSLIESSILILIGLLFSALFPPVLSAACTIALLIIGHSSGILRELMERTNSMTADIFLGAGYYLFPNLEKFNMRNEAVYQKLPDIDAAAYAVAYAVAYGIVLYLLARRIFRSREF
jgi:Cu-processing system permease protein